MIRFGTPRLIPWLILLLPLGLFLYWSWRNKEKALREFIEVSVMPRLLPDLSRTRQKLKTFLLFLAAAACLVAFSRPQWGYRWEEVHRKGVNLMIAVDISKSMLAEDLSPSRLERARRKVTDLLGILEGDRVGLIGFAGRAFVLTPLTLDYGAVRLFLDSLDPELIPAPGTAVGEAIELAIQSFAQQGPAKSEAVILMSDGEDLSGDALSAAKKAGDQGIRIYTLGVGTPEGAPIPEQGGGFKKDQNGSVVLTRLDESALQEIAKTTGGRYLRSVAGDQDLREIYRDLRGETEEQDLKGGMERRFIERFPLFLLAAILLLLADSFLGETKGPKPLRRWFLRPRPLALGVLFLCLLSIPRPAFAFGLVGLIREGERLYAQGDYEKALEKFQEAQEKHPDDPRIKYNLANTYYQLKRYDEAKGLFDDVTKEAELKLKEKGLYNQGDTQYRKGELEEAIRSYEAALQIDPKDEDALYNLELVKKQLAAQKEKENKENKGEADKKEGAGTQGEEKKPQEEKGKQGASEGEGQEEKKSGKIPATGMSQEEAERWLAGIREGKHRIYGAGKKDLGKGKVEKDW